MSSIVGPIALALALVLLVRYRRKRAKKPSLHITNLGDVGQIQKNEQLLHDSGFNVFDYIIIGGGTAGCVLASRLSENPKSRVLVLESGGSAMKLAESRVPSGYSQLFRSKHSFRLYTEPQANLSNSKKLFLPRGRLLGGCSSINAEVAQYGSPQDFDQWGSFIKDNSWSWENFRKYINKFENHTPDASMPQAGASQRGRGGPVRVGYFSTIMESSKAFVKTCMNIGISYTPDFNGDGGTIGVNRVLTYVDENRKRVSSESAYLTRKVLARPNLKVTIRAHVTRILFDENKRAVGVEYTNSENGPRFTSKARREIILSAGAVHSPHILMLSGVGPATHLREHGIPVVHDLSGVGKKLVDHPIMDIYYKDRKNDSPKYLRPKTFMDRMKMFKAVFQYAVLGTGGPLATNWVECAAFVRSDDPVLFPPSSYPTVLEDSTSGPGSPDLEIFCTPLAYKDHGKGGFDVHTRALHVYLLKPLSNGTISLASDNPFDAPRINPNYLQHPDDVEKLLRGTRLCFKIASTEPFASHLDPKFVNEELDHGLHLKTDDELKDIIRSRVETVYHPTSSCRMAPPGEDGVVDSKLRVYGLSGLRICDASVFPWVVSGHTAGACYAAAEKLADEIMNS